MNNQEKIDNLINVVKSFARKFASIEEKIDTIEVKLDKFRVGIKEGILDRLEKVEKSLSELDSKPVSRREFLGIDKPQTDKEVKPAMYKRITVNLQELQSMFNADDTWEINFLQGILDFTGQTVTEKQLEVLKQLAGRVEYEKELVTER